MAVPSSLEAQFEKVLGARVDGDPSAQRRLADAWEAAARWWGSLADQWETGGQRMASAAGVTALALARQHQAVVQDMRNQSAYCRSVGEQCRGNAAEVELGQWTWDWFCAIMATQLAADAVLVFTTGPVGLAKAAATRSGWAAAWRQVLRRLVEVIATNGIGAATSRGRILLLSTLVGGGLGASVPLIAQALQLRAGDRDRIDWARAAIGGVSGAAGGFAGAGLAVALAPYINRATMALARSTDDAWRRFGAAAAGTLMVGAAAGTGGGVGGVLAGGGANWLITGESGLRWSDFTTGAFTGILGEVIGGASRTVHAGIHTRSAGSIAAGPDAAAPQPGLTAANLTAANLTEVDSGAATTTPAPTPDDVNIEPMPDDVNIEPIPDDVDTPIPTLSEAGARAAEPGPPSGRLSTEAAERIATLDKRHTHMVIGLAQLAREWPGIPWSGTATSAELETLTTAIGSVRSSGVVGPEPAPGPIELAIQAKMDEKTLDRVGDELVRYVLDERDTNAAATHESAGPRLDRMLQRLHDRPGLLHDGRTQDIETLVSAIRWTDQLALPDRRMPLLPEDGVTMADVELYRRQAADAFADAPGWSPANAIDESPAAREVRQHRARSLGHVGALPRDWVRPVVEEPGNRDLTAVSKLFAARMPDGRTVYVRVAGDPDGFPVLLSPGTPVGVDGALPDYKMLYDQGFCLIIVERPGYGESDPLPARSVADCARDIIHIAVELFAFDTYAVLGRSGGGSVGIATGALDPTHVARVVSVVGTSPVVTDIEGWTAHMGQPNKDGYKAVRELALRTRESGRSLLEFNDPSFHVPDHMFIGVNQWRLARGYERALAKSVDTSWVADAAQLKAPWGISFADYPVPIDLVHGVDDGAGVRDEFSPVSHSRINAALIERAQLHLIPGIAHMSGMDLAPVLCRYLSAERDAYFETATWIPRERAERIQAKAAAPLELPTWAFWTHGKWHERFGRPANSPEFLRIDRDGR